MAQRQSTFRVSSESIQGADSYVIFRHLPFGLVMKAMDKSEDSKTKASEEKAYTEKLLKEAIVEWNWVDDNGALLKTPAKGLKIETLLTNEIMWLVEQVTGREKAKNSS